MFFANFNQITYDDRTVTDITHSFDIIDKFKNDIELYEIYTVQDGERLEQVADKTLGNQNYYWIIMMMNDIINPFYDFPLSDKELKVFIDNKYNNPESTLGDERHNIHHYEYNGIIYGNVDPAPGLSTPVTNEQYEINLNEEKRKLKIPKPIYVNQIIAEFRKKLSEV